MSNEFAIERAFVLLCSEDPCMFDDGGFFVIEIEGRKLRTRAVDPSAVLGSAEVPRLSAEHGERVNERGTVTAPLPAIEYPCGGDGDGTGVCMCGHVEGAHAGGCLAIATAGVSCDCVAYRAQHDEDCVCAGRGVVVVRVPSVERVDAVDDGLDATLAAIAQRDIEREARVDPYLGDTIENLRKHNGVHGPNSSSEGKRKTRKDDPRRGEKPPTTEDGRIERRGRKAKHGEAREITIRATLDPKTEAVALNAAPDVPSFVVNIAKNLMADPAHVAIVEAARFELTAKVNA